MTARTIPSRRLAADAYEAMIEAAIIRPDDLYDLDGETFLRRRDGRVETFLADGPED